MKCLLKKPDACYNCPYSDCIDEGSEKTEEEKLLSDDKEVISVDPKIIRKRQKTKEYIAAHKEKYREYQRLYRLKNKEKLNAYRKQYYKEHREEETARQRKYEREHRDQAMERVHRYLAKKLKRGL